MKIDKDPRVVSDHYGHHLLNAKGEKVKTFSKDRAGLKQARMSLYKNFKRMDLPPIDPTQQEESKMSDLEKKLEEALNETITVNTTSDNNPDSQDSVTITANGEDAAELMQMLKLAGMNQTAEEQPEMTNPTMADMIQIIPLDDAEEEVEEDLANTPNDAMDLEGDVDTMVNAISGGLNKKKNAYAKAQDGDNALAVKEDEEDLTETYVREFDEFKVTQTDDGVEVEKKGEFSVTIGADMPEKEFSDEEKAVADELFDLELEQQELDSENYVDEDALDENAFNMAAAKAAVAGEKEFEFGGEMHKVTMDKETAQKLIDESVMEDDVEEGIRAVRNPNATPREKSEQEKMLTKQQKSMLDDDEEDALEKEMSEELEADEEVVAEGEEGCPCCGGGECNCKPDCPDCDCNKEVDEGAGCSSKKKMKEDEELDSIKRLAGI